MREKASIVLCVAAGVGLAIWLFFGQRPEIAEPKCVRGHYETEIQLQLIGPNEWAPLPASVFRCDAYEFHDGGAP